MLEDKIRKEVLKLQGPIVVFGAGGFVGCNLFAQILKYRDDVYAVTSKPFVPWRLDDFINENILFCDITDSKGLENLFLKFHFKTIFNLAAYGAYSKQDQVDKIYNTNFIGLLNLLELVEKYNIRSLVYSGSSSEYGTNSAAPTEDEILEPNSHYSVSKVSASYLIKFYGSVKKTPVLNLRYYSVYGPFEEPDRLIPKLIQEGLNKSYPPLVEPDISRDFIYVDDIIYATLIASNSDFEITRGMSFNVASGKKTTIRELAYTCKELFSIDFDPEWGVMPNRSWDLKDWFGNTDKTKDILGWESTIDIEEGLKKTISWQKVYSKPLYERKILQDRIKHKISAVIACYKDAEAIPIMYDRLKSVFNSSFVDYEIIFVNDCSPDNTIEVLNRIIDKDERVIAIEHSRNFGSQSAFLSGMEISTGDCVVLLDGDLQDPPELIEQFLLKWKEGNDVVYGRRVDREGNKILVKFYKIFYRIFRKLSYIPIPLDAGDFSLMDRKVVEELIKMPETDQFMRGLRAWVGFRQIGVDYIRPERMFGVTTNNWRKNIGWARKAIFSFSYLPLELLTYLGFTLTILSFVAILIQILFYFIFPETPKGISTIICLILFFGGMNLLAVAIIGEYQSKILEETKKRPKFIRKKVYTHTQKQDNEFFNRR
ncbi:MAG: NAD-dependent epimerase/dehydratase family protein [Bacteroidia bacterium]|nr:NAD-dependent epimerase/dehydratase family protein [Bacteroidia bacterium]